MRVSYADFVYGKEEINAVVRVLREKRSLMGNETRLFEQEIAALFGKKHGVMVNSGSSANLLALEILNLPQGSEVITPVLTFSTTLAPIIQKGLKPILVDVQPGTYLINIDQLEAKITDQTRVLMIPSLLGNVPDMKKLRAIADKHYLMFIEDSCDTLGATFDGQPTGIYSDISTASFYGSHIISGAGGGGMICVHDAHWLYLLKMLRGWGRMSALFNESESIEARYSTLLNDIPYDAKYIFEQLGYNFLPLEISAAFALEQLKKLKTFLETRWINFGTLYQFFSDYKDWFELPNQDGRVVTSWLAFPLTIKSAAPFSRYDLVSYLEKNDVQTRPIFTGNVLRQPAFYSLQQSYCDFSEFPVAENITRNGFVIGCHHGMTGAHRDYLTDVLTKFLKSF